MSIEQQALKSADPVSVLEPENLDHPIKELWVVANVSEERGDWMNLVTCGVVCWSLDEAKKVARQKAEGLLQVYNDEQDYFHRPRMKFEEAWTEVDRFDSIEHEYGYDPEDSHEVSFAAIRVFRATVAPIGEDR